MNTNKERLKPFVFLSIVIAATLFFFNSSTIKDSISKSEVYQEFSNLFKPFNIDNTLIDKRNEDADSLYSIFIKSPTSEKGIEALVNSIIIWDSLQNDSLIKIAVEKLENSTINNSLRDKFYFSFGQYYLTKQQKFRTPFLKKLFKKISDSLSVSN